MFCKNLFSVISLALFVFIGNTALAACPSADLTGDCFVDYEDFAQMAIQWLTTDPCVPDDMVYIPDGEFEMGDHFPEDISEPCDPCDPCGPEYLGLPLHAVLVDSFFMSKYETTNQQYCDYLNDANSLGQIKMDDGTVYASSDNSNDYPYCDTHIHDDDSQIDYSGGVFSVRTKNGRDMSDDPMVQVSWYGAASYCNWRSGEEGYESCYDINDPNWPCDFSKHGYRLPTEAECEYAARGGEHSPYHRFPWGDPNISHSQANYYSPWEEGSPYYSYDESPTEDFHPLWNDGIYPYTSPVGFFDGTMKYKGDYNWPGSAISYQTTSGANGYDLYDMSGNVWEWCNDWYDSTYYSTTPYPHDNPQGPASGTYRVLRGGAWIVHANHCRVANRGTFMPLPDYRSFSSGFRIVLDLN